MNQARWVLFQQDAETLCSSWVIFHGPEPFSALTHVLLQCCYLYSAFFRNFSEFVNGIFFSEFVNGNLALTEF